MTTETDISLRCRTCGEAFVWTAEQQRIFRERRMRPPRRCGQCVFRRVGGWA